MLKILLECRYLGSKVTRSGGCDKLPAANGHVAASHSQAGGGASLAGRAQLQASVAGSSQKWPGSSAEEGTSLNGMTPAVTTGKNGQLNGTTTIGKEHQAPSTTNPQLVISQPHLTQILRKSK